LKYNPTIVKQGKNHINYLILWFKTTEKYSINNFKTFINFWPSGCVKRTYTSDLFRNKYKESNKSRKRVSVMDTPHSK